MESGVSSYHRNVAGTASDTEVTRNGDVPEADLADDISVRSATSNPSASTDNNDAIGEEDFGNGEDAADPSSKSNRAKVIVQHSN